MSVWPILLTVIATLVIVESAATTATTTATNAAPATVFNLGSCQTPDKENGLCIHIDDCGYLFNMLRNNKTDERDFLKSSQCGLDNTSTDLLKRVLVCCSEKRNNPTDPTNSRNSLNALASSLLPNTSICGNVLSNRIYGGQVTLLDEFPWMALLSYKKPYNNFGFHCGGALINSRYVITAAHCVVSPEMPESWSLHSVRLGEWDTTTNPDCRVDQNKNKACAPPVLDVEIERSFVHNLYMASSIDQFHDIAMLRLKQNVEFTNYITPICLPVDNEVRQDMFVGTAMDVAGWGLTEEQQPSTQKLKIVVKVWNTTRCQNTYRSYQVHINGSQLCAGGEEGIDTCRGDSGGPLMVQDRVGNRDIYFIAGIVSYGPKPCGLTGWPGVYTRIGFYTDWIISNLSP